MIPYFPKQIAYKAVFVYLITLAFISLFYFDFSMSWGYIMLGVAFVSVFFVLSSNLTKNLQNSKESTYVEYLFIVSLGLRLLWVLASYFYYMHTTGSPFEFEAADSIGYHEEAKWLASESWSTVWSYYFGSFSNGISDVGYPLYLTVLYKFVGSSVIIPRIIKAVLSSFTCFFLYKLASRTFNDRTGRMAGILAALTPNLIIYCGYHLKETEMLFLEVAFLERFDYLIRTKRINIFSVLLPTLLVGSLFFFRTVLGIAALFSL